MDKVRIGVIGVGLIGKQHLNRYASIPGAQVVAVADINEPEARRVAEMHSIPHVYTDFRQLLARDDIDAVDVCLHNNLHAPVTIAALEAGKHVYCEKPMAGAYADALAMYEAAKACDRKLSIQLATLYRKETKVAKRLIDQGRLGRLFHARSTGYRRRGRPFVDGYGAAPFVKKETAGGGALYDMGVYHIAQILYLLGLPQIERISGKVYQEMEMDAARRAQSGFDVEELAVGLVTCQGGLTIDIIEAWAIHLNPFEGSYIVGSQGGIRLEPFSYHFLQDDMDVDVTINVDAADRRWHMLNEDESAYDSSQHHWIAALQGRVPLLPTADVALQTMLVSEGIYLSDRLGREVTADEVREMSRSTAVKV
ncbi:MAG TPA: Gfo/Idh/MocA family oxidoreductase [Limnochordia bacterium]